VLYAGTPEQQKDYALGVLASAIAIFAVIMGWFIAIMILACLGPRRVGIWSGRQVPRRPKPTAAAQQQPQVVGEDTYHDEEDDESWQYKNNNESPPQMLGIPTSIYVKDEGVAGTPDTAGTTGQDWQGLSDWYEERQLQERCLRNARIAVLVCSVCITICVILMWSLGLRSLDGTANNAYDGLDQAKSLSDQAIGLIDRFLSLQDETVDTSVAFLNTVNAICPAVASELCTNLDNFDSANCDFNALPALGDEIESIVNGQRTILLDNVYSLRADVVEFQDIVNNIDNAARNFDWGK